MDPNPQFVVIIRTLKLSKNVHLTNGKPMVYRCCWRIYKWGRSRLCGTAPAPAKKRRAGFTTLLTVQLIDKKLNIPCYSLFAEHHLLFISLTSLAIYCLWVIICCLLVAEHPLLFTYCLLIIIYCLLLVAEHPLLFTYCLLIIIRCFCLLAEHPVLFTVRGSSFVVYC